MMKKYISIAILVLFSQISYSAVNWSSLDISAGYFKRYVESSAGKGTDEFGGINLQASVDFENGFGILEEYTRYVDRNGSGAVDIQLESNELITWFYKRMTLGSRSNIDFDFFTAGGLGASWQKLNSQVLETNSSVDTETLLLYGVMAGIRAKINRFTLKSSLRFLRSEHYKDRNIIDWSVFSLGYNF